MCCVAVVIMKISFMFGHHIRKSRYRNCGIKYLIKAASIPCYHAHSFSSPSIGQVICVERSVFQSLFEFKSFQSNLNSVNGEQICMYGLCPLSYKRLLPRLLFCTLHAKLSCYWLIWHLLGQRPPLFYQYLWLFIPISPVGGPQKKPLVTLWMLHVMYIPY